MKKTEPKNIAASVRARLLNWAKEKGIDFNRALLLYSQESFLFRLSKSRYADQFILKGGVLFFISQQMEARPTRDIDFLVRNISNDQENFQSVLRDILNISVRDGIIFQIDEMTVIPITEAAEYIGLRVKVQAELDGAVQRLQIDTGFGDVVSPAPVQYEYPSIFKEKVFSLTAYSWETVIAEKFESIIRLRDINSRMKDFYDIRYLCNTLRFDGSELIKSIRRTFKNRRSDIRYVDLVFNVTFGSDRVRQSMWNNFLKKISKTDSIFFPEVIRSLQKFLYPICESIRDSKPFNRIWDFKKQQWI